MPAGLFLQITEIAPTVLTPIVIGDGGGGRTDYMLVRDGWAPGSAAMRDDMFGGHGPYMEVEDELILNITGETASAAFANLRRLAQHLEQAERWQNGENVEPVVLQYSPVGSTVSSIANPLQWVILGRAAGDQTSGIQLSPTFNRTLRAFMLEGVRVRFMRHGDGKQTTVSASSVATVNGDLVTITNPAALAFPGPTKLIITNIFKRANFDSPVFVLLAEDANDISIQDAEDFDNAGAFISVADSARLARNTNVLRYTPTGTAKVVSGGGSGFPETQTLDTLIAVFANIRNNSSTASYTVWARIFSVAAHRTVQFRETPGVVINAGATAPKWYFLGLIGFAAQADFAALAVQASAVDASLDIDTVLFLNLRNPNSGVIEFQAEETGLNETRTYEVDHRRFTSVTRPRPSPRVWFHDNFMVNWAGDPILYTRSASLFGVLLGTQGVVSADRWRQAAAADALFSNVWTAERNPAFPIPQ